ncbi:hypothetical protein EGJ55_16055 [Pseudomonas moraviensis]|nr:hypothetical protein EGJ55_16055 [Pseudomonas moraviensis]
MIIKLVGQRRDDILEVMKDGDTLVLNGEAFDLSRINDGDTLPQQAIESEWFAGSVDRVNAELVLTLILPNPWNYSPEQAFPDDLVNVLDGRVELPKPLPNGDVDSDLPSLPSPPTPGRIDWTQLVTKEMKTAAEQAAQLVSAKAGLAARNNKAVTQIARIQDRVDTIGFGIDIGEATADDEAEQAALLITLKAWKAYKFALGKVTVQQTWYQAPVWPAEPPIPEIIASPLLGESETI